MARLPKAINRNELPSMTEFSALPKGNYNTNGLDTLYDHINEILELGLTKKYSDTLERILQ